MPLRTSGASGSASAAGGASMLLRRTTRRRRSTNRTNTCNFLDWSGHGGPLIALGALHLGGIDPLQDKLQIGAGHFDLRHVAGRRGEREGALFEALVEDGEPIAVPPEDLEAVARAIAKDEQMAGERIAAEEIADQPHEAVKAAPHSGMAGGDEHTHRGRQWPPE